MEKEDRTPEVFEFSISSSDGFDFLNPVVNSFRSGIVRIPNCVFRWKWAVSGRWNLIIASSVIWLHPWGVWCTSFSVFIPGDFTHDSWTLSFFFHQIARNYASKPIVDEAHQAYLELHFEERLSIRAIARGVGIGRSSVARILDRAKVANLKWPLPNGTSDTDFDR